MFEQLLSVFLKSSCPLCKRVSDKYICQYCLAKLSSCQFEPKDRGCWAEMPVFAWGKYDGELKRAIASMKYDNNPNIGVVLGELLAKAWLEKNLHPSPKVSVVPIPLYRQKAKQRGFNQAEKIARGFCNLTGYSLSSQALIRVRETKAMFELNPEERIKNLQGAFRLGKKLPQYPVLLLDDIYTMGTTLKESARVLQHNQIEVVGSVVVAATKKFK